LEIEQVRRELGITTAALLGVGTEVGEVMKESRVERLIREIKELSPEERRELMEQIIQDDNTGQPYLFDVSLSFD
jgi:O-acetyl-ADP-ribose deacetylase (regulator of RNase III)